MDPQKEKSAPAKPAQQDVPPLHAADDWSRPDTHPRLSAAWPLLWFALALSGIVLWGFLSG